MKKIIYVTVILASFEMIAFAQEECPSTLVHYWKLNSIDDGVIDHVGEHTAQIESSPLPILGIVDSGLYFNGLSEISIPDNITFDWDKNASFTIEFWIKKSTTCPSVNSISNNVVIGRDDATTELHWWVGVDCKDPGRINFTLLANDGNGTVMKSKQPIIDGNWHHIAIVRNGEEKTSSIYIDAELDTTVSFTYDQGFGSIVPINMGWLNLHSKYHLDASLDELGLHNVALPSSVISEHYNSGAGRVYCTGTGTPVEEILSEYGFNVFKTASSEIGVRFHLNTAQHISMAIFDASGRNLGYLLNEKLHAGYFEKTFRTDQYERNTLFLIQARFTKGTVTKKIVLP